MKNSENKIVKISDVKIGTKLKSYEMVMVVTGKNLTSFLGYISYNNKAVGQCSLDFSMFENSHYNNNIKILE